MKVLDLQCAQQHVFEGWFASEQDFGAQRERALVACPMCGDTEVVKKLSAPRLNLGATEPASGKAADAQAAPAVPAPGQGTEFAAGAEAHAMQAAWLQLARRIVAQTEDVGPRFAEEARRIHYGESEERGIRGRASPEQTRELIEEGIAVLPLALPEGIDGPLQ